MNIKKQEERNKELFLYKTGLGGDVPHTLFECALKFELSVNQIHRNVAKFLNQVTDLAQEVDIPTAAQRYSIGTDVVERMIDYRNKKDAEKQRREERKVNDNPE